MSGTITSGIKLSLSLLALGVLSGCQSTQNANTAKAEQTSHLSQSVYQVEFDAAQHFAAQTTQLSQAFTDYCANPGDAAELKSAWQQTMQSWMALQGQERGPLDALEQNWNVQFWPDKKNTTGRKMAQLLAKGEVVTAEQLSTQSVTVQGLGALEWLLYDTASNMDSNSNSCQLGVAIASNLHNKAQIIANAWLSNPWAELDKTAWYSEYIALLSNQLEFSMSKLSRPMGNIGHPRPYFSESWRSKTSMQNLKANLIAMKAVYLANGKGLDHLLRERGHADLADRVLGDFDDAIATWPMEDSLFDMLSTRKGYQSVLSQYNKLEELKYLIHEEVAVELKVVIGFNSTDGD
ncbi:hypothetical protein SAMN04488136_108109 [Vibrio xiamenensis]|uniref:Imelysin-like domain-containing protein n=1 Tax=Vibrio xiamenensis TaxID=861298 RepID=A0A1G7ZQ60_9VIBR|nr:imelysin family protein [Vibrio xiamenensis]SDH10853.1 hypothetical protein SAMN04488136_108109 [Vibrio xiamenensis]